MDDDELWRHNYYSRRLGLDHGSPDAQALASESFQLIHEIDAFLRATHFALAQDSMSVLQAIPTLRIHVTGEATATQLQAFKKLVHHSTKLNASPDVKCAFWMAISGLHDRFGAAEVIQQLISDPAFPRFLLCIGGRPEGSTVCKALCNAVYDALTTAMDEVESAVKSSLELSFGIFDRRGTPQPKAQHTGEQMQLIERMVDRLLYSPNLQF